MPSLDSSHTFNEDIVQSPLQEIIGSTPESVVVERDERYSIGYIINDEVSISIGNPLTDWTHFRVERSLICRRSGFLRSFFGQPPFRSTYIVTGDSNFFGVYIHWLLTRQFLTKAGADNFRFTVVPNEGVDTGEDYGFIVLARLYVLALVLEDPEFRDTVMDTFIDAIREIGTIQSRKILPSGKEIATLPGPCCINAVYCNIAGEDILKSFLVTIYAGTEERMRFNQIHWRPEWLHHEFVSTVVERSRPELRWIWGGVL